MIDGIWQPKFDIDPDDQILTAGSCFAQHISAALDRSGFNWLRAERRPYGLDDETARAFGYDIFSFRTGNIYTTRMLKQWLSWALNGEAQSRETWRSGTALVDPVRPTIQPNGFDDEEEFADSRQATLNAIRNGVEDATVFIFTLGLTEMWFNKQTALCYASCPGTLGGEFDPDVHGFHDLDYTEILSDLEDVWRMLREHNPKIRMLLTVSPVPLAATAKAGIHALAATMGSKSVLRAAAGAFASQHPDIDYFPSFEIVTNPWIGLPAFQTDLRSVRPEMVDHVMRHFLEAIGASPAIGVGRANQSDAGIEEAVTSALDEANVICEEMALERFNDDRD